MRRRTIAVLPLLLLAAAPVRTEGVGLPAREALASLLPHGNLIVYGTVIDTVDNVYFYFPAGEFARFAGAPRGSQLRFVHVRVNVLRVLRGRTSDREVTFGLPVEFIPAADSARAGAPPVDREAVARWRAAVAPGTTGVFPLLLEPRAPGSWLLASPDQIIPETNGRVAGEKISEFAIAARAFYARRDLATMTLAADAIAMGRVNAVRAGCESRKDTTFACVDLSVDRLFKAETDTVITVLVPDPVATGWRVPIVRQDIPKLLEGETYLFLLSRSGDGGWRLHEGRSGVLQSQKNWVTECPRDGGPVYGINMDADSFQIWVNHVIDRAAEGKPSP